MTALFNWIFFNFCTSYFLNFKNILKKVSFKIFEFFWLPIFWKLFLYISWSGKIQKNSLTSSVLALVPPNSSQMIEESIIVAGSSDSWLMYWTIWLGVASRASRGIIRSPEGEAAKINEYEDFWKIHSKVEKSQLSKNDLKLFKNRKNVPFNVDVLAKKFSSKWATAWGPANCKNWRDWLGELKTLHFEVKYHLARQINKLEEFQIKKIFSNFLNPFLSWFFFNEIAEFEN